MVIEQNLLEIKNKATAARANMIEGQSYFNNLYSTGKTIAEEVSDQRCFRLWEQIHDIVASQYGKDGMHKVDVEINFEQNTSFVYKINDVEIKRITFDMTNSTLELSPKCDIYTTKHHVNLYRMMYILLHYGFTNSIEGFEDKDGIKVTVETFWFGF